MHSGLPAFSSQGNCVSILFIFLRHYHFRRYLDPGWKARKALTMLSA
jgi:hypothetical protein